MNLRVLTLLGLGFLAFSCSSNDGDPIETDKTAPTIKLDDPDNGENVWAGKALEFKATFEDNAALASYNVTIHSNFDGHSHARLNVEPFSFDRSFTIEGRKVEAKQNLDIPVTATAGPYHFVVKAIDKAGNATSFTDGSSKEVEIWIQNTEMATTRFLNGSNVEIDEYKVVANQQVELLGTITAGNSDLVSVTATLQVDEDDDHTHDHIPAFWSKNFSIASGTRAVTLQEIFKDEVLVITQAMINQAKLLGEDLELQIVVKDAAGNYSRKTLELEF